MEEEVKKPKKRVSKKSIKKIEEEATETTVVVADIADDEIETAVISADGGDTSEGDSPEPSLIGDVQDRFMRWFVSLNRKERRRISKISMSNLFNKITNKPTVIPGEYTPEEIKQISKSRKRKMRNLKKKGRIS